MADLEAVTPPIPETPAAPTIADVVKADTISLTDYRAVKSGEKTPAAVLEPQPPVPEAAPETPATETPEQVTTRARDEKGRFTTADGKAEPAAPVTEPEDDESSPPQTVSQFQKRLNREVAKRAEWERRYHELATKPAVPAAKAPEPAPVAPVAKFPTFEQYGVDHPEASYEDYLDARAEAKIDARLTAEARQRETAQRDHAASRALHQLETLGAQTHADFSSRIQAAYDAGVRWPAHVTEFVLGHTESPQEAVALTYALAKDHTLAKRISALPPGRAYYELGKLTASLSGSSPAPGSGATPPPVTKAPAPFQPNGTSATASTPTVASLVTAGPELSLKRYRELKAR